MPMISYAQNAEDVLLARLFPVDHRGFYIDVGANHPTLHSVTRHFYNRGWRGINIEPVEHVHQLLCSERPDEVNLNIALSERSGRMTLHVPGASLGMATLSIPFARGLTAHGYAYEEREIEVRSLAEVCEEYAQGRTIDFLKIDVEGHEREVIAGGDWARYRPVALVVEATVAPEDWEPILESAGYIRAAFDGLNRYYIRRESAELVDRLAAPANLLDDFISYEHWQAIEQLRQERDEARAELERLRSELGAGPRALAIARGLNRMARRFPGVASLSRRFLKRAG